MKNWFVAAQTPWFRAKSRASSGHRGSLEISGIITRCFVKAAVPQEPLLGPIGQGVMVALNAAGTRGPALGISCFLSGSIKQTIEVTGEAWASMEAHKSFRTSERLAPLAIISSVRFSAADRDSRCGSRARPLFEFRASRPHHAGGVTALYFAVHLEPRFRGAHHALRSRSVLWADRHKDTLQERRMPLVRTTSFDDQPAILDTHEYPAPVCHSCHWIVYERNHQ